MSSLRAGPLLALALGATALALPPAPARADAPPPAPARADAPLSAQRLQYAREQARKGVAYVRAQRWDDGRQALREAVEVKEMSVLLYYLGLCEVGLGNLREARRRLLRAVEVARTPGESGESAAVRRQVLEDVPSLLTDVEARLPRVTLHWSPAPPPGLTLRVDGEALGPDEATNPLRLDPGEHALVAQAPGKKPAEVSFRLVERQHHELSLVLEAEAPHVTFAPPVALAPPRPVERSAVTWQRPAGYVGLGLGAALLGAGVFSSLRVQAIERSFDDDAALVAYRALTPGGQGTCALAQAGGEAAPGGGAASARDVRDTCDEARRFVTLQYVFYGAGAAFAAAGAYFAFVAPPSERKGPRGTAWRLRPAAGPSFASATWALTY